MIKVIIPKQSLRMLTAVQHSNKMALASFALARRSQGGSEETLVLLQLGSNYAIRIGEIFFFYSIHTQFVHVKSNVIQSILVHNSRGQQVQQCKKFLSR